jgi:hypothetical protein
MMNHPHTITLDHSPPPEQAFEIARLWVSHRGPSMIYMNAHVMPDPRMFGMLVADTAMQGAKAYAQAHGISETEAMARIWEGLDAERANHSGDIVIASDEAKA